MPRGKNSKKKQNKGKKKVPTKKKGGVYQMGGGFIKGADYSTQIDGNTIKVTKMTGAGQIHEIVMKENYLFLAIMADNANLDSGNIQIKKANKFRLLTEAELANIEQSIDATGASPDASGGAKAKLADLLAAGKGGGEIMKYNSVNPANERVSLKMDDKGTQTATTVPVVRMIVGKDETDVSKNNGKEVQSNTPANDKITYILVIDMSTSRTPTITQRVK